MSGDDKPDLNRFVGSGLTGCIIFTSLRNVDGRCGRHDRGPARLLIAAVLNIKASTAADAEAPFAILSLF
jgi:hypothetical protein